MIYKVVFSIFFFGVIATVVYFGVSTSSKTEFIADTEIEEDVQIDVSTESTEVVLSPVPVELPDGTQAVFQLAQPFKLAVAAEDLGKARFMAMSPDGRLFVPDLVNYQLSHEGRVFILEDFNSRTKSFERKHTYLTGLRGPNSLAFYTDEKGKHWLYLALTAHLVRYPYEFGDIKPAGEPEIILEFPNKQSPGEVSVVWHITRTIILHNDRIYVSVGSGCNSCEQLAGAMRAMIYSVKPDGTDIRIEGRGLRNTVGITMVGDDLYATANGVDHLGNDAPDEALYKVEGGKHYGWPFCYLRAGKILPDTTQEWDDPVSCESVPLPVAVLEPRSAPLGLRFFEEGHPVLKESFLVALHGSFNPDVGAGYEIRRVLMDGTSETFMNGFLKNSVQMARPVDFLQHDETSFFFTDDHAGRIYYVYADE